MVTRQVTRGLRPYASIVSFLALILFATPGIPAEDRKSFDWRNDYAARKSFDIAIDTTGYSLPTAIAFVPHPGPAPDDPLYYVTELRGSVKVVTNNRRISEFAKVPAFDPDVELPDNSAEAGLAGICLEPEHGYIFITYAANDSNGILRNHLIRYETKPKTFATAPRTRTEMAPILSNERSSASHQIGECRAEGDSLYVGVGEAMQPANSRNIDSMLGKVIRMTLDGNPHPENPFYIKGAPDSESPRNYVFAYGLRNPFGIEVMNNTVYVADNGINLDRFVKVNRGEDYLWNGLNWSIAAAADAVFAPAVGPVHLEHYPIGSTVFPEVYRDNFFLSASAGRGGGILTVPYDPAAGRPSGAPFYLVRLTHEIHPAVVALAFGPEGLYFAPILPNPAGETPILKLTYNPDSRYPNQIGGGPAGQILNEVCRGCHIWKGNGGMAGPHLGTKKHIARILERLNSDTYRDRVAQIDHLSEEPFRSTRQARHAVLEATGADQIRAYFSNKIREPRFDNPNAQMPNLGLSNEQVTGVVDLLMAETVIPTADTGIIRAAKRVRSRLPFPEGRKGDMGAGAAVGFIFGMLCLAGGWGLLRWFGRG